MLIAKVDKIIELRKAHGLNQKRLSEKAGLPVNAVFRIETGAYTRTQDLRAKAIANALECNRRWWIDLSANDSPQWAEVSVGITSRGNSINEQSQEYYDMAGRGVAESEVTGVSVSRTFTGFRRFGDAAQDAIMDRLYDLDNRKVKFIECYDNLGSGKPNGRQGEGVLSITDDGSGDAQNRENISFGLKILGTPQKGTVTIGEDGTPTFSPQAAEAKAASK